MNKEDKPEPDTYFFLDELPRLGKLLVLDEFLATARSKGGCAVIGLQDIEALFNVYGKEHGGSLLGNCGHTSVLKINQPVTAEWASKTFGTVQKIFVSQNVSTSEGVSQSASSMNTVSLVIVPALVNQSTLEKKY